MSESKYKILHLASFKGNIGDIANHVGFYNLLDSVFDSAYTIDKAEIRDFYYCNKNRVFDYDFINTINQYDLFVIGGGAFFHPEWDCSSTGTTIDIKDEIFDCINTKVLFNGLGCLFTPRSKQKAISKCSRFLEHILPNNNVLFTVRNDGSFQDIKRIVSQDIMSYIHEVPDSGFFTNWDNLDFNNCVKKPYVAISIGEDDEMFNDKVFVESFAANLEEILNNNKNLKIIFVPHVITDVDAISQIISSFHDYALKLRLFCAPFYCSNKNNVAQIFNIYANAELVLAMRFHANVCPHSFLTPTIGFSTKNSVIGLYNTLSNKSINFDMSSSTVDDLFSYANRCLIKKIEPPILSSETIEHLNNMRNNYRKLLKDFLFNC